MATATGTALNGRLAGRNAGPASNSGRSAIVAGLPYVASIRIRGTADMLFHRWQNEAVAAKASATKNSKAKKTDDLESYVYRDNKGLLALPGEYLRQSILASAKFESDPRSKRKSGLDLFKAGVMAVTQLAAIVGVDGKPLESWDYEDSRRVTIQRAGITRTRPAIRSGWEASVDLQVILPEYIDRDLLHSVVTRAGMMIGVGDFRPTYGRFAIVGFDVWQ